MKFLFNIKYFFISSLLFSCFLISAFYAYYLHKYPKPYDISYLFEYYPKNFVLKIGNFLALPKDSFQHFLNFQTSKKKGFIRIGTFGDSHTYGVEVDKIASYPYQLQQLFDKHFPNKNIEVLNFGISGHSFQEQFFLWEKYAQMYKLDYILFGPRGLHFDRDVTFRRNFGSYLNFPKSRFILSKNKLKLVHIKGNTPKERYKNYYKLIPSFTALLYDRKPFKIWEWLFPFLRNNMPNPFYYTRKTISKESSQINKLLLQKIRTLNGKKILFMTDHQRLFKPYQSVEKLYNLNFVPLKSPRLYERFGHRSSLGYEQVAKIYFHGLIGKKKFFLKNITCSFINSKPNYKEFNKNFDSVNLIQIFGEKTPAFILRNNNPEHYHNKVSYSDYKTKGTKSFIAFFGKDQFLESIFFPLFNRLKEDMKISIHLPNKTKLELGSIKPLDAYKKFFVFFENYLHYFDNNDKYESFFLLDEMPLNLKKQLNQTKKPLELFVGDYKLGSLLLSKLYFRTSDTYKQILKFIPRYGYEKSFLFMGPAKLIREKDFPDQFSLSIKYTMDNGDNLNSLIPDWKCYKYKQTFHLNLPNFKPLNLN